MLLVPAKYHQTRRPKKKQRILPHNALVASGKRYSPITRPTYSCAVYPPSSEVHEIVQNNDD